MICRILKTQLLIVFAAAAAFAQSAYVPKPPSASSSSPSNSDDADVRQFLDLANQARAQAGAPPLKLNRDLNQAALAHTQLMVAQHNLSHQLPGEPELMQRLTANSKLLFDRSGENVGYAGSVEQAHVDFMNSPPHRKNLLDPAFNLVGFGVVRAGNLLWVTQDFAHGTTAQSGDQVATQVANAVKAARAQTGLAALVETSSPDVGESACAMAKSGSLTGPQLSGRHIIRYTSFTPSQLPAAAVQAIDGSDVREFSVGTCTSQGTTSGAGAYYIVLVLR
ncbi:MAG TPA: CAP domain-containing protein [Terriglobales bacterium]